MLKILGVLVSWVLLVFLQRKRVPLICSMLLNDYDGGIEDQVFCFIVCQSSYVELRVRFLSVVFCSVVEMFPPMPGILTLHGEF